MEKIVLGGGCFWCLDASYRLVDGVESVVSGYAGGEEADPTYKDVSNGSTGHAEVVNIEFDSKKISLEEILEIFFTIHDPTTKNRQGADVGTQYRSIILYENHEQKGIAERIILEVQELFDKPIVTELKQLVNFYTAENYHQNYYANNQNQGYCQVVINPKLAKLRENFPQKLK